MTIQELGNALVEARKARGLTLRDVERDTRISTKYLQALENGQLEVLPAPVYARAFMRTYAQYLGLDASQLVQQLPGARPEPVLPPLPDVHRESAMPLVSASWMIAGVVVVLLLVVGAVMFWSQSGGGGSDSPVLVQEATPGNGNQGGPGVVPPDDPGDLVIEDGVTPDLVGQHLLVAITDLTDADVRYVVVEVDNESVPSGIIFNQSPLAGTPLADDTVVTVLASR